MLTELLDFSIWTRRPIRFVQAAQLNECGLACLAMVLDFHHSSVPLDELRQRASHSGRGATLLSLRDLADGYGLRARGVRLDPDAITDLPLPAILHWNMNHFVVLEGVRKSSVTILDPAAGRRNVSFADLSKSFTGVALLLEATDQVVRRRRQRTWSINSLVGGMSRWRLDIGALVILSLILDALAIVLPLQLQFTIDQGVANRDLRLIWMLAFGFSLIVLMHAAMLIVRGWASEVFASRVGFDIRDRFVTGLHARPPMFFLKHQTGDLLARSKSTEAVQAALTGRLVQAGMDAVTAILVLVLMVWMAPALAAIVLVVVIVNFLIATLFASTIRQLEGEQLIASAKADILFIENVSAATTIRLFARESVRIAMWRNAMIGAINAGLRRTRVSLLGERVPEFFANLEGVLVVAVGAWNVILGTLTLGTLFSFIALRLLFVARVRNSLLYIFELKSLAAHIDRISGFFQRQVAEAPSITHKVDISVEGACIECRDIWFRYGKNQAWVFQGFNLTVQAGEAVAITGVSGCGKTTLLKLMAGILEPERGSILINGVPLAVIDKHERARLVGVVQQDDILFGASVAENIAFFDFPMNLERIEQVARMAYIHDDIVRMPMGFLTPLAERASDLSGGQRQRLMIARALYHSPRLLLLDEATSHLDGDNEAGVSAAIRALTITRVIVAHRAETIRTADRVVTIDIGYGHADGLPGAAS